MHAGDVGPVHTDCGIDSLQHSFAVRTDASRHRPGMVDCLPFGAGVTPSEPWKDELVSEVARTQFEAFRKVRAIVLQRTVQD